MILIPAVCDMVDVPVVAAGGISERRGYRAALALGAQGVQIGTAFLASEESPASQAWKDAILGCGDAGTTRLPVGGWPCAPSSTPNWINSWLRAQT